MEGEQYEVIVLSDSSSDSEMDSEDEISSDVIWETASDDNNQLNTVAVLEDDSGNTSAGNRVNVELVPIESDRPNVRPVLNNVLEDNLGNNSVVNRVNVELIPIDQIQLPEWMVLEIPLEEPQDRTNLPWMCHICDARFVCRPELRWHVNDTHLLDAE